MSDLQSRVRRAGATAAIILATTCAAQAAAENPAAERLSRYLQVDNTNPPGNEVTGVRFLAAILKEADIAYETAESAPGSGNLWARLPAANPARAKPGIVLLHHIDVVSASSGHWDPRGNACVSTLHGIRPTCRAALVRNSPSIAGGTRGRGPSGPRASDVR